MLCNAKLRNRNGKQKMDGKRVWMRLEENKEMINKRLPGIEWREPGSHQDAYSLRTSISAHEGIENISDERMDEIVNKLAEDMKLLTEIVEELKLDDEIIFL